MADVDHEYGTHLGFVAGFLHHQIIFCKSEVGDAVVDLCIFKAFGHVYGVQIVAVLKGAGFPIAFFADANFGGAVAADAGFLQFSEDLIEGKFPQSFFKFWGQNIFALSGSGITFFRIFIFFDIAAFFQILFKIGQRIFIGEDVIFLIEHLQPFKSFFDIT